MWEIIDYKKEHFDEIIDMTIEYYGVDNDISNKDFIYHEYFKNNIGDAIIKLAYDYENNTLAGQYIVIPMQIKVGNELHTTTLSLNTLTRSQYRGQGVFTALADAVYATCTQKGYSFCYGAPNPNSHPGFIKKLGFKDIGIMPLYLKIIHPSFLVRDKFHSGILTTLAKPFNFIFHTHSLKENNTKIINITDTNIDFFDSLWDTLKDKYPILGVRNAEYIKWRYMDIPLRDYTIYAAQQDNQLVGYIISRITEVAGMKCGMIVDFLVDNNNKSAADSLLSTVEKDFYENSVGLMGCLMQSHFEEAQFLKKYGFFKCPAFLEPQPFPIIFRQFNDIKPVHYFQNFENWFFTMGDYDVI